MSTAVAGNATHAAQKAASDRVITHGSVSSRARLPGILRQAIALPQRGELRARPGERRLALERDVLRAAFQVLRGLEASLQVVQLREQRKGGGEHVAVLQALRSVA